MTQTSQYRQTQQLLLSHLSGQMCYLRPCMCQKAKNQRQHRTEDSCHRIFWLLLGLRQSVGSFKIKQFGSPWAKPASGTSFYISINPIIKTANILLITEWKSICFITLIPRAQQSWFFTEGEPKLQKAENLKRFAIVTLCAQSLLDAYKKIKISPQQGSFDVPLLGRGAAASNVWETTPGRARRDSG